MRIYELLVEEQEDNSELIAKYIARNCKPFLVQINERTLPLYRGQSDRLYPVCDQLFKSSTFAKRKPRDSSKQDHQDADAWFLNKFGIRFRSDHIMFTTSDKFSVI